MASAAEAAKVLDSEDPLAFMREEFNIPTAAEIASTRLVDSGSR
jgi:kynureninase